MANYFLDIRTLGRSRGSSAVSAAAYRAGERIVDERTGRTYDHLDRQDVMHKEIILPARLAGQDIEWALDRSSLWNAAERAETRVNARVAREFLLALPFELDAEQRLTLTRTFAQELSDRYGAALDVAIHAPRDYLGSDPRNFHAHLLATTRQVERDGLAGKTQMEWNDSKRLAAGLGPGVNEFFHARQRWAEVANEALHQAHVDARIDHRTLRAQGIDREPYPYIPRVAFQMERHGHHSDQAHRIREAYEAALAARERERLNGAKAEASRELQPAAAAACGPDKPPSLEQIRREAREDWLRMREARKDAQSAAPERDRGAHAGKDDDLSR